MKRALCLLNTLNQSINSKETALSAVASPRFSGGSLSDKFPLENACPKRRSEGCLASSFFFSFTLRAYFLYANQLYSSCTREGISLLSFLVCIFLIGLADLCNITDKNIIIYRGNPTTLPCFRRREVRYFGFM